MDICNPGPEGWGVHGESEWVRVVNQRDSVNQTSCFEQGTAGL